MYVMQTDPCVV